MRIRTTALLVAVAMRRVRAQIALRWKRRGNLASFFVAFLGAFGASRGSFFLKKKIRKGIDGRGGVSCKKGIDNRVGKVV